MTDRTAPSSDAAQDSYPFTREWLRWMDERGHVVTSSAYVKRNPLWAEEDAHTFIAARTDQETDMNPSNNRSRHDELVALLTEIRDRLPEPPTYTIETRTCRKAANLAAFKHEAETPMRGHGECCEPAEVTDDQPVGTYLVDRDGDVSERREDGWHIWSGWSSAWGSRAYTVGHLREHYAPLRLATPADLARVGIEDEPAPADDLPGEPVEPGDLRAGDRVEFTWDDTERIEGVVEPCRGRAEGALDVGGEHLVATSGKWAGCISDVRLIERAPREDEDEDEDEGAAEPDDLWHAKARAVVFERLARDAERALDNATQRVLDLTAERDAALDRHQALWGDVEDARVEFVAMRRDHSSPQSDRDAARTVSIELAEILDRDNARAKGGQR